MKKDIVTLFLVTLCMFSSIILKSQTKIDPSTIYIHAEKASFTSKVLKSMFSLFGFKKGKSVIKKINRSSTAELPSSIPKSILKKYNVRQSIVHNRKYWTIRPKTNSSKKVLLYLHGGVYVFSIKKYHWKFAEALLLRTNATIVIPDYPLAPESNVEEASNFISQVYQELLLKYSSENIILAGDSAGAGLALGFAMTLRNENKPQPNQIILLSPWLDVTMSNEAILEIDKKDKVLGIKTLQIAGKTFAGKLALKDYRVSPIHGDFSALGQISIFIGTHDLFLADCRKLKRITTEANIPINYFEYDKMFHGWYMARKMKESKAALLQISSLLKSE